MCSICSGRSSSAFIVQLYSFPSSGKLRGPPSSVKMSWASLAEPSCECDHHLRWTTPLTLNLISHKDFLVSLLKQEFGQWGKELTAAFCRGSPGCDRDVGTPTKPCEEIKLIGCLSLRTCGLPLCHFCIFLLMKMYILKAVLLWNNTSCGI